MNDNKKNNQLQFYIKTFGCQMNVSDSQKIAGILERKGYVKSFDEKEADIIVVNVCSVRQSAVDRAYAFVRHHSHKRIILAGCVLERDKQKLKGKFSEFWSPSKYFSAPPCHQKSSLAYVPIMTGCNNFCSYCAVPYTRGREISRPASEIMREVKDLAKNGVKEIVLLGQNVNSYKHKKTSFARLLDKLAKNHPQIIFKFISSHPKDFSDDLIKVIAENKNIHREIHLPVQAGSDRILKAMNRPYTQKHYLDLIKKIKKAVPEASFTTDVIVGFPGETRRDFEETVKVFKLVSFNEAYIGKYSPRPGTYASKLKETVSHAEKKRRERILRKFINYGHQ